MVRGRDPINIQVFQHQWIDFQLFFPYLLGSTIVFHLQNVPYNIEETVAKKLELFYVVNCATSVDDAEKLEKFKLILSISIFSFEGTSFSYSNQGFEDLFEGN